MKQVAFRVPRCILAQLSTLFFNPWFDCFEIHTYWLLST